MKFEEVQSLGKLLDKYLNYGGFNLWHLNEAGIYNSLLRIPKKKKFFSSLLDFSLSRFVKFILRCRTSKPKNINANSKILFVPFDISHVNTFEKLISRLNSVDVLKFDSFFTNVTRDALESKNIEFNSFESYIDDEILSKIKKSEFWLKVAYKRISNDSKLNEIIGKNYEDVMAALNYLCISRKKFLESILMIEVFKKIYSSKRYKLVIVADDVNAPGKIAVMVANRFGVKSVDIQHGQLQGNPVGEISADKMFVNGVKDKQLLESLGAKGNKIIVTGQPRFDNLNNFKFDKLKLCKQYGLDPHKKIIMFSAQKKSSGEDISRSALDCFINECKKLDSSKFQFIITMREDMNLKDIPSDYKSLGIKVIIGGDIHKILACCDVFTTAFSTVAIESVLMGRPVITINLNNRNYINYTSEGVGYTVFKAKDFLPKLHEVLNDIKFKKKFSISREQFVKNYNFSDDGMATKRQIKLIKNIIKQKV